MIIRLLILLSTVLIAGCLSIETKCCDLIGTYTISDSLYVERYRTFCAGVFGERIDYYLTDSTKFRKLIGSADEHRNLFIARQSDRIELYTIESRLITDTLNQKTILLSEILSKKQFDSSCTKATPLFGKDIIDCNNCYGASSYKTDDGYYIADDQFKCGNDYMNAVYFTDSLNFRILLGFYNPGHGRAFTAEKTSETEITFYETDSRRVLDTVDHKSLKLSEFLPGKLEKVCENK